GIRIVQPMPGLGRDKALKDIIASGLIGEPEFIVRMCKGVCKGLRWGLYPFLLDNLHETQVHIDIIISAGPFPKLNGHGGIRPNDPLVILYHGGIVLEFYGKTESDTNGLCGPGPFDFVFEDFFGKRDFFWKGLPFLIFGLWGRTAGTGQKQDRNGKSNIEILLFHNIKYMDYF